MAEPVQGIRAVPDEGNSRYFHVVVSGPEDVSFSSIFEFFPLRQLLFSSYLHACVTHALS